MKKTMLDYVFETPDVLKANLARSGVLTEKLVSLLTSKPYRILRIVASGSSRNAALCARPLLRRLLGLEVLVTPPHTFSHYEHELPDDELTLAVSQSGYSMNVLEALDVMRAAGATATGITGDVNSDIKERCDILVDYGAGEETVGYVTKGVTTLALFFMLFALEGGITLGRVDTHEAKKVRASLENAIEVNRQCARRTGEFLSRHYMELSAMSTVYLCAGGGCLGVASEGALKLGETVQIPAIAYETEESIHGPELQLTPNYTLFFLSGVDSAFDRISGLWRASLGVTARSYLLTCAGNAPDDDRVFALPFFGDTDVSPLCFLPFFQILSYQLTEDLHLWHKHPLCARYEDAAGGKSENYVPKEVM